MGRTAVVPPLLLFFSAKDQNMNAETKSKSAARSRTRTQTTPAPAAAAQASAKTLNPAVGRAVAARRRVLSGSVSCSVFRISVSGLLMLHTPETGVKTCQKVPKSAKRHSKSGISRSALPFPPYRPARKNGVFAGARPESAPRRSQIMSTPVRHSHVWKDVS
jgi:hypothetical protein